MHGLDDFFATVKLPSISQVTQALIKTLNDENAGISEVSHIIAQDPALAAKLLRLANSAQFGLPRGVGTLGDAIRMVGIGKVRSLTLGASLSQSFAPLPGLNLQEFWANSMACAGYAQWLAATLNMEAQQAWLTGMMLRLGELLIGQANPQALLEIEKLPRPPEAAGAANAAWSVLQKGRSPPNWHAAGIFRCRSCRRWSARMTRWSSRLSHDSAR